MKTIDVFRGKHFFLSNFYITKVKYRGQIYMSVEHAFQAAKTLNKRERIQIGAAATPGKAKALGRKVKLRKDWELIKDDIMLTLLRSKFDDAELKQLLLKTGDCKLVEGNHWGDIYWGICGGKGKNRLGVLLMQVRKEL